MDEVKWSGPTVMIYVQRTNDAQFTKEIETVINVTVLYFSKILLLKTSTY